MLKDISGWDGLDLWTHLCYEHRSAVLKSSFLHSTHFLLVVKSEICVKSMLDPSPWALPPAFYIAPKCVKSQNHQPFTMMMKGERLGSGTYWIRGSHHCKRCKRHIHHQSGQSRDKTFTPVHPRIMLHSFPSGPHIFLNKRSPWYTLK